MVVSVVLVLLVMMRVGGRMVVSVVLVVLVVMLVVLCFAFRNQLTGLRSQALLVGLVSEIPPVQGSKLVPSRHLLPSPLGRDVAVGDHPTEFQAHGHLSYRIGQRTLCLPSRHLLTGLLGSDCAFCNHLAELC